MAKTRILRVAAALVAGLLLLPAARADQVTEQIDEALHAYQKKDLTTAVAALEAAAGLIRQIKADAWKAALPQPPSGWTADAPETEALAPALLGGGTSVQRKYHKGDATATLTIIADSPLVQGIAAFLASGFAGLGGDVRIVVIDGRRFVYTKGENSYQTQINNRVLVKIEGNREADDAALRQVIGAIKFADLEKLAK